MVLRCPILVIYSTGFVCAAEEIITTIIDSPHRDIIINAYYETYVQAQEVQFLDIPTRNTSW